jgi:hypothetical protein
MKINLLLRKSGVFPYLLAAKEYLSRWKRKDYSQFGEQNILSRLIPDTIGTYLDIGSGRPISGNNTFFLYRKGWDGILVDPIRANTKASAIVRPRDLCLQNFVGQVETLRFFEFFPYEFSTSNFDVAKRIQIEEPTIKLLATYCVSGVTASSIFSQLPRKNFVLVNIDAEGYDFQVLQSLNLEINKPDLICIEDWEYSTSLESNIHKYLSLYGYSFVERAGLSSIYKK